MACETICERIRPFLEDLLDENEYQDVRAHLEECVRCRTYASSIGTLTYQLHELGEVKAPRDFISTVLYELKQPVKPGDATLKSEEAPDIAAPRAENFTPQGRPFLIPLLIASLICSTIFIGVFYFKYSTKKAPNREQNIFQTAVATNTWDAPPLALQRTIETNSVMEKIKVIVYGDENDKASADEKLERLKTFFDENKRGPSSLSEWRPIHWHYHVSSSSQSELLQTLHELGLTLDYESSEFFILYVPKSKLEELVRRLSEVSGVVTEFNVSNIENIRDEAIQVSFYLT